VWGVIALKDGISCSSFIPLDWLDCQGKITCAIQDVHVQYVEQDLVGHLAHVWNVEKNVQTWCRTSC
jgi:hypothetical protein